MVAAESETTMPPTETKRETWADWILSPATMTATQFVRYTNARIDTGSSITEDDLETWQDDGLLPYPVEIPGGANPRYLYPPLAWRVVADLLDPEIEDAEPEFLRSMLRSEAQTISGRAERRQTWRDFMPEGAPMPALRSHDELLDALRDRGVDLPSSTLEYYRQQGILPRPIRRRHGGATRPVYPEWMVEAVEHLRTLQDQGFSLEEIKPRMHTWMIGTAASGHSGRKLAAIENTFQHVAQQELSKVSTMTVSLRDADGNEVYRHRVDLTDE